MNEVRCPRCGGVNPPSSAFCGACGAPLAAQQSGSLTDSSLSPVPQQPGAIQASPPTPYSPPPNADPPPPGAYPPPTGVYPPVVPGPKIVGDNTKWAVGLGIAALFCCGPITGIIGFFLAKKDMDEIAAGRAPYLDESWAKGAYYLNIVALILFVFGFCLLWGVGGLHRF
jgi:hypothetical protein